ncbi:hypothetical protein JQC92_02400 [Shewanella sp. 202IG2-18]|uniref:hypothetical protein n=1 Tax=Parashewanella hymeniacidonis TaxID=2807618 RepID=UPI0019615285|nr:hypothetical protein [Parashewanella hymeniacidonis]MBM7070892.1 hypothetical protein [Parashewanella hymeniacidonis]
MTLSLSAEQYRLLSGGNPKPKATRTTADKASVKSQVIELKKKVALNLLGLPDYEQEYKFHDIRRWRLDYAWPQIKVALEVHGGVHTNGRHNRGKGFTEDRVKMNTAALEGWLIIEATTEQVKNGLMRQWVELAIQKRS